MANPGIGASSILGIALEELSAPVQAALAGSGTGGTLAAGTYLYVVTAVNSRGETMASNEQSVTVAGATSSVVVSWAAVTDAASYKVYRTAAGGGTGTELFLASVTAPTVTYTDTGAVVPSGALPTSNTAVTPGTYKAPTKFVPYLSESLKLEKATNWRRPVRNTPGLVGAVDGDSHVNGDVVIEALSDVVPYFLYASRATVVKTGSAPYTYTATPSPVAVPDKTLSLTILRNGVVYAYVGVSVGSFKFDLSNETLQFTATCVGFDELVGQATPTGVTWPTTTPMGAGSYNMQIPTATQVFDTDSFTFESNDNATPQFRMRNTASVAGGLKTAPSFVSFGESDASINVARDFLDNTEYEQFKALTAKSITLIAQHSASDSFTILAPVSIIDTYEVNIGGQGDLVRASVAYQCAIDGTGKHYQVTVVTPTESIV